MPLEEEGEEGTSDTPGVAKRVRMGRDFGATEGRHQHCIAVQDTTCDGITMTMAGGA